MGEEGRRRRRSRRSRNRMGRERGERGEGGGEISWGGRGEGDGKKDEEGDEILLKIFAKKNLIKKAH